MVTSSMPLITTRTRLSLASIPTAYPFLTIGLSRHPGGGSKSLRKRSRIIVARSMIANPRTTVSLPWPQSLMPISSQTCSRTRNSRGLTSSWHLTPRTSSVDHPFFITPQPADTFEVMEQPKFERRRACRKEDYGLDLPRSRRVLQYHTALHPLHLRQLVIREYPRTIKTMLTLTWFNSSS